SGVTDVGADLPLPVGRVIEAGGHPAPGGQGNPIAGAHLDVAIGIRRRTVRRQRQVLAEGRIHHAVADVRVPVFGTEGDASLDALTPGRAGIVEVAEAV